MGKQKKKQKKRGNPLWTLVFLAALAVFCFSGYKLIGIYLDYKTGTDEYRDLQQYTTENYKNTGDTGTDENRGAAGGIRTGGAFRTGAGTTVVSDRTAACRRF